MQQLEQTQNEHVIIVHELKSIRTKMSFVESERDELIKVKQQLSKNIEDLEGSLEYCYDQQKEAKRAEHQIEQLDITLRSVESKIGQLEESLVSARQELQENSHRLASIAELKQRCLDLHLERDDLSDTVRVQSLLVQDLRDRICMLEVSLSESPPKLPTPRANKGTCTPPDWARTVTQDEKGVKKEKPIDILERKLRTLDEQEKFGTHVKLQELEQERARWEQEERERRELREAEWQQQVRGSTLC